jgi:hypothetical protein
MTDESSMSDSDACQFRAIDKDAKKDTEYIKLELEIKNKFPFLK